MDDGEKLTAVVSTAHEAWRRRMLNAGWVSGESYDPARRTHPWVCAFDALPTYRRGQLERFIVSTRDLAEIMEDVDTVIGDPEWTTADVYVGMRVRLSSQINGPVGSVVSWDVADAECGAIEWIYVRWPDGEEVEYAPALHELARVT